MARFHTTEWDLLPDQAFQPRGWKGGMTLEGGKGSSAPPPDPELIQAQIRSMGIQDGAIQQVLANANKMLPLQEEQMRFGLNTSRAAYDQSQADRSWMLGRRDQLSGLQDSIVAEANSFDTEGRRQELAAQASADVAQAFGLQRDQTMRQMSRIGANPNSGKFMSMSNQLDMAEASAKASAANKTREAARLEGMTIKNNAANMMAGYPGMGMQATGAGAGFGAAGLNVANSGLAGMNSGFGAAGTMGGQLGQNAAGMYNAQANYKNSQDQIAASSDPFNTILGAAAGVGTSWAMGKFL